MLRAHRVRKSRRRNDNLSNSTFSASPPLSIRLLFSMSKHLPGMDHCFSLNFQVQPRGSVYSIGNQFRLTPTEQVVKHLVPISQGFGCMINRTFGQVVLVIRGRLK